jgi:hypothetical protein
MENIDIEVADQKPTASKRSEASTIQFPVYDLETAVEVAKAVYRRVGLGSCPLDELAAELGTTMSGNFRAKNAACKLFGFVEKDGQSSIKLTELGARVTSNESENEARVTAFLNVPLYSNVFEKYRGKLLPPNRALEHEVLSQGVIPTMTAAARLIFLRSARQAGFFEAGEDRLVRPRFSATSVEPSPQEKPQTQSNVSPSDAQSKSNISVAVHESHGTKLHPFISGLLQTLPVPGSEWSTEERANWLEAASNIFKLIYKGGVKTNTSSTNLD